MGTEIEAGGGGKTMWDVYHLFGEEMVGEFKGTNVAFGGSRGRWGRGGGEGRRIFRMYRDKVLGICGSDS
jgi:hypothetical protein